MGSRSSNRIAGLRGAFGLLTGLGLVIGAVVVWDHRSWVPGILGALVLGLLAWDHRHPKPTVPSRRGEFWWLGAVVPLGFATWVSFLYLGRRLRSRQLTLAGLVYLCGILGAIGANVASGDERNALGIVSVVLYSLTWLGGAVHAVVIRRRVREALDALDD